MAKNIFNSFMKNSLGRRTLLRSATALAALPAFARFSQAAGQGDDSEAKPGRSSGEESMVLAKYVAETPFEALPAECVTVTKRSILDAIGVSMAASGLAEPCRPFVELATTSGDRAESTILGVGEKSSMMMAALANGAFAHALDYEDAHDPSRTHPNAATVAAAIAAAEAVGGVSGKRFIAAVALGCDLTARLSMAQGRVHEFPEAFYPPAIVGTFGAVAASSRILGLSAEQTRDAFSVALCQNSCSAQILHDPYSDIRAVRDGLCAQAGLQAALLGKGGVKGFARPFEGEGAFFQMYSDGRYLPDILFDRLGEHFAGEDISFKPWPSCRDTHLFIQAVLEARSEQPIDIARITRIKANVSPINMIICEPEAEKRRPQAAIDAKFSLYFTVAAALKHGEITLSSFTEEKLSDPEVLKLADKVHYEVDEESARPLAEGGGTLLTLTMDDGSERRLAVEHSYGSPAYPMEEADLVDKFVNCLRFARQARDSGEAERIAKTILSLEDLEDVRTLAVEL